MANSKWVLLCITGGILIVIGGIVGNVSFYSMVFGLISSYVADETLTTILGLILQAFGYIAAGGGLSVIAGAIMVSRDRVGTGKFVIGLGAGMGLIGLIVFLVTAVVSGTIVGELMGIIFGLLGLNEGAGFAGVILTILARSKLSK